jgi:Rrf2 family protein
MSGRFQIAVHIMTLLCTAGNVMLSSDYIAGSVNINPVLIRKELSNLIKHGLVISKEGKSGGYSLARPANEITMAEVYKTVQVAPVLGTARNIPNPKCPVGKQINKHLDLMNKEIDKTIIKKLDKQTIAAFTQQFD